MPHNSGFFRAQGGNIIGMPLTELGTSQVSTDLPGYGVTTLVASTTAPEYTQPAPLEVNQVCWVNIVANTSSGTALLNSNSTGISFSSSGANQLTFDSVNEGCMLISTSSGHWRLGPSSGVTFSSQTT